MTSKGSTVQKNSPKSSIAKKNEKSPIAPTEKFYQIPFLNRPLPVIMSILRYMQFNREEKVDKEVGMYYTPAAEHPFDPLSKKQMEIYGGTFSTESNTEALLKINPISTGTHLSMPSKNIVNPQPQTCSVESLTYSKPIGPLPFLSSTVPQSPDPTFVNYLKACSK